MINLHNYIESRYTEQVKFFENSDVFQRFDSGAADSQFYDNFIANLCHSHLKSPQILAFLYAVAPPQVAASIQHNMLEELGLDEQGISHSGLLHKLAKAAGFTQEMRSSIEFAAHEQLRQMCTEPLLYETLKDLGLSVLLEVTCFEWMLSRLAGRMGQALSQYRGLSHESLEWFFHHSEVDILHAEEGMDSVVKYIEYYDFDPEDLEAIIDITFRENIFIKRYFGAVYLIL
jgi:pyrroloquinoline quinone (PQQ) biosynthesis protein C